MTPIDALHDLPGVGEVFAALSGETGVHAVGGAVRDVLLGRRPSEVDLVVVGDATVVARRLVESLGGRLRVHDRFKTATVELAGAHFDLASARRERYPRPGALPKVELGATLAEDLERRDFTVNAVAVALADGAVTAHPYALADLEARRLRVLHPRSFHDDPTRLIRLCRYSARLGLTVERSTRALVGAALEAGALDTVSGERIGRELRLAAREPQPETLRVLACTGVAAPVLGTTGVDDDVVATALALCPPDGRRDLLALAAAMARQDVESLAERLRRFGFAREDADRVVRVADAAPRMAESLRTDLPAAPSRVHALLSGEPVEAVALAGALSGSPEGVATVERFLREMRHVRPLLSGHDLQRAGLSGPEVGRGLAAALAAGLDRPGADRAEQLAAALAAVRRSPRASD